ncbi:uncharacterized protein LOC127242033 isoform X2 [Andrographis paniculata]|uniref:uncharacterized protein LOC127242033 isoform X2 n=1 Tax=Andrographis paniculata TaxID=175694 RepID=UPI0021E7C9CE|nr:uncharacterized protein LOC127242033 isoform X2 [Andrographis paniculata]
MFFNDFIQRRLASLLQPWLRDPDLELKLGFFRLNGALSSVSFNISALNELLDDPSRVCFKEASVEHMSLHFSPFSSAAFTLIVRGLYVVLGFGEEEDERGVKWKKKPRDTSVEERNKILQEIDPEGHALHGAIKRISEITNGTWRTSFVNTVIRHCKLQLHDVHVLLQSSHLPESVSCSMYMEKFGIGSHAIGHRVFVRGLMRIFSVPLEESSFDVDVNGFEIKSNTEDSSRCICPATNVYALVKLNHLQWLSFFLHFPSLEFLCSPADLSVLFLLYALLSKEQKVRRSGKQLWSIAASKISSLVPTSSTAFVKVFAIACLWLRYINMYRRILLLVGYPADAAMKRSVTSMFKNAAYSRSVRTQWKLISGIEKGLSAEAIAVARRIVRSRLEAGPSDRASNYVELLNRRPFSKICQLIMFILRMIGTLLVALMRILFLHKVLQTFHKRSNPHFVYGNENNLLEQCVIVKVEEISLNISPDNKSLSPLRGKTVPDSRIPFHDSLSFHFSVNRIFLRYLVNISEQCLTFASGKVHSFSSAKAVAGSYFPEHSKKKVDMMQVVLWSDPAQVIYFPGGSDDEATDANSTDDIEGSSIPQLDSLLVKLWLNWNNTSKSEEENIPNVQDPWILYESRSCVTDHDISYSSYMVVGKLNINLEHNSFTSAIVLFRQMQRAMLKNTKRKNVLSQEPTMTDEGPDMRYWGDKFTSCSRKIEMNIVKMLPEKRVEIAALIAGPHIVLSLLNNQLHSETRSSPHHMKFSLESSNIEFLVSPTMEDHAGFSRESTESCTREMHLGLEELKEIDILKSDNGAYSCEGRIPLNAYLKAYGFKVYLDETIENQKLHIAIIKSTAAQVSCIRKYYHSFSSSVVAVSAASHWIATGFNCSVFLEEMYVLAMIIAGVFDESLAFTIDGSGRDVNEGLSSKEWSPFDYEGGESSVALSEQIAFVADPQVFLKCACELRSFDLVIHNSRRDYSLATYMSIATTGGEIGRKLPMHDIHRNGIYATFQKLIMEFTFDGHNVDSTVATTEVRYVIFRYLDEFDETVNKSELKHILSSLNFLTEASLHHGKVCFFLRNSEKALQLVNLHTAAEESGSSVSSSHTWGASSSTVNTERPGEHWFSAEILFSEVYLGESEVKDILINDLVESNASISIGGEIKAISCECKFVSDTTSSLGQSSVNMQLVQQGKITWPSLEAFCMKVLHFSLILVERDESGKLQKLLFEVDSFTSLELSTTVRKISASISRFSILSQFMHGSSGEIDVAGASGTSSSVSQKISHVDISISNPGEKDLNASPQKYILKDLQCSIAVDGPVTRDQISRACSNQIWVGNGSILGFDMTLSLCEIKMLLTAFEIFSNIRIKEGPSLIESRQLPYNHAEGSIERFIPDGTIVAIQDVDQHMYVAVRGSEGGYDIGGANHYSLGGEQALFRVKYHKPRRWKPGKPVFSLMSLYAKDNSGEPLRLSCHQRSRFVDVSSSKDSEHALWRALPFNPGVHEDAIELESSATLSNKTFHLVNKKNDYAVAFVDGTLEFVNKPGNVFKWKVFDDDVSLNDNVLEEPSIPTIRPRGICTSSEDETRELKTNGNLLGIIVTLDKVILTVVHEISDTQEKFPLLQASIIPSQTVIQILDSKVRVMNTTETTLYYFEAQQNSWKELIQPFEVSTFFSHKFLVKATENLSNTATNHFHARVKEVTLLLSELSVDIFLFVIGKLDLAGPYAVNNARVLANCCKIENKSGLTLVCQFYDNQDALISARQSTSTFLRHLALDNQPPEASFFSIQLVRQEFSTSPIRLSLLEAQQFAWRTRIVSRQDSKLFPGPIVVVDISKGIEDGLSINVSPLLKIYNETDFSMELHFQRSQHDETESASLILRAGEIIDDGVTAFTAIDLSGGSRKALTSLSVGNYVFSFRPNIAEKLETLKNTLVEWSDDLKGGKPVRLSGLFDKLSYQVRKALSRSPVKISLSSASCAVKSEEGFIGNIHFLIQTVRKDVPVVNPDKFGYASGNRNSPVAMQEQKEIFLLPTIEVSNLLHTDIHVSLTDKDPYGNTPDGHSLWNQATISYGSAAKFYANPAAIFFVVTLTSYGSRCKPINSSDWVRKLQKQKDDVSHLDIELDFDGGKYFALLRLSRGPQGTLEAGVFTPYSLRNDINEPLFCIPANQKPLPRIDLERLGADIPLESGSYFPANSTISWFLKCHKLCFKLLVEKELEAQLDLDALSGLTEIDLKSEELYGLKSIMRLGVSLRPALTGKVSSHVVSLNPRYVIHNESEGVIAIRQCYMEGMEELITINSKQRTTLRLNSILPKKKETNIIENLLRKHTKPQNDPSFFIQFRPCGTTFGWSGPVCVASLGRFFLRFRKSLELPESQSDGKSKDHSGEFAAVHAVEEGSAIVLQFHRPPVTNLPYRIENGLHHSPITYYQKGSVSEETLGAGDSALYAWDDLTLPHKLVVLLDVHLWREINLDKVRSWKPFYSNKQARDLGIHLPLEKKPEGQKRTTYSRLFGSVTVKVGFEVYADGVTRVLRICELSDCHKENKVFSGSHTKLRLRISYFSVHLLEHAKQEVVQEEPFEYAPIIITRLERINWDAIFNDQQKYNQIRVQSLSMDEKWVGAPFATMLRRHQLEKSDANDYILHVAVILLPTVSSVKQVKYLSIVLQPLDLNLDEETLMKIVPFWRSSLSNSSTPRQQYYFDHFEIHPIKIVASFLPGDAHYRYSSTQETLRSLLHSVIKMPAIKKKTVELNGVLVTHALITIRELTIKCAQHYSWYSMRAVYIAKGSPLLPPGFASIFDDLASSSLDVFFDPSNGLLNIPGVTLGTLKLISKFIDNKGFSGTKRYFGDMGKTLKTAGSNMLFAAVTEISDSVLRGAETSGFTGMVNGFHQGILKLAMEPSVLSNAFMEGGPDRKIKLDRSPGVDELYIEGYLQAMLDTMYKQEYLRVRVVENQVILKNLPPSSSLINEIMENVKGFLASKALLKGEPTTGQSLRLIRGEREWRLGPTLLTLCEHLFVSFIIRVLRKQSGKVVAKIKWKEKAKGDEDDTAGDDGAGGPMVGGFVWKWGIGKFILSGIVAYIDGYLCRNIPHPLARRIVSGYLLSFLDQNNESK